jgi:hypothetical protein
MLVRQALYHLSHSLCSFLFFLCSFEICFLLHLLSPGACDLKLGQ